MATKQNAEDIAKHLWLHLVPCQVLLTKQEALARWEELVEELQDLIQALKHQAELDNMVE